MSEQFKSASYRALIGAALSAAMTFLGTWVATDEPKTLIIATATAFLTPLIVRFGGEGYYDTQRDKNSVVKPGDVGSGRPPMSPAGAAG